jgi:hypothetical protein
MIEYTVSGITRLRFIAAQTTKMAQAVVVRASSHIGALTTSPIVFARDGQQLVRSAADGGSRIEIIATCLEVDVGFLQKLDELVVSLLESTVREFP